MNAWCERIISELLGDVKRDREWKEWKEKLKYCGDNGAVVFVLFLS